MDPGPYFEKADAPDRIGVSEMKYVEGFYRFWSDLRNRFPDMFIDNCASGGRRLDYKTAALAFPLNLSDFTCYMPYEEECVFFENMYVDDWMPLHGSLISREDDAYHAFCGMGCGCSSRIWEFNGREPDEDHDYDLHRRVLEWARLLRDLHLKGDVYPLVDSPELDMRLWNGQQVHVPEEDRGAVMIFRRKQSPDADFTLDLAGIPPEREYSVGFFTGGERKMSGKELSSLAVHLDHPGSVQIIRYEAVK